MKKIFLFLIILNLTFHVLPNQNSLNSLRPYLGLGILLSTMYIYSKSSESTNRYIKNIVLSDKAATRKELIYKFSLLLEKLKNDKEYEQSFDEICQKYELAHRHKHDTQLIWTGSFFTSCLWLTLLILPECFYQNL
ncbi:MAG: hypothetical protein P4L22_05810 [Candidatus Babeliales bacterium]|nr:hypothetical protein [Candidatus Babeliales bacterium]